MKKTAIILVILLLVGLAAGYFRYDRAEVFTGSCVRNPDSYTLEFTKMNQTDRHTLALTKGDVLLVDFAIEKGRADLTIGIDGKTADYVGNDIKTGSFSIIVPEDGSYTITVAAKHASGYVGIRLQEQKEGTENEQ